MSRHECSHGLNMLERCEECLGAAFDGGRACGIEDAAKVADAEACRLRGHASTCESPLDRAWLDERATVSEKLAAAIRATAHPSNQAHK